MKGDHPKPRSHYGVKTLKIGEAAAASGCHLETVRYYERIGLLPAPPRTGSGYRDYGTTDVDRLRFVSRGRDLGFSLDEIRSLLRLAANEAMSCQQVDVLAREHLAEIQTKIKDLSRIAADLERVIKSCGGGERANCTILSTLRKAPTSGCSRIDGPKHHGHVGEIGEPRPNKGELGAV